MATRSGMRYGNYSQYVSCILGLIILSFLVWYLYQNQDALFLLGNVSYRSILPVLLMELVMFLIAGYMDKTMIGRFDSRVSFLDCYMLGYANNFLNKILPTIGGGAAFRAVFLKKKYQLPYSKFVSTIAGLYVVSFLPHSLTGMICLLVIFARQGVFNWLIFLIFLGIFSFCLITILFSPKIPESQSRILKFVGNIFEGWQVLKQDSKLVVIYTLSSLMLLLLSAMQTYFSYQALGVQTDMVSMLFLSTLGIILAFLNFTPDGIGIKEGVYVFSSELVRIPDGILVLGSLVLRAISLCTTFVIGGICYLILSRQMSRLED